MRIDKAKCRAELIVCGIYTWQILAENQLCLFICSSVGVGLGVICRSDRVYLVLACRCAAKHKVKKASLFVFILGHFLVHPDFQAELTRSAYFGSVRFGSSPFHGNHTRTHRSHHDRTHSQSCRRQKLQSRSLPVDPGHTSHLARPNYRHEPLELE